MPFKENLDVFFDDSTAIDLTEVIIEGATGQKFKVNGYLDESMLDDDGVLRMVKQLTLKEDSRIEDHCLVYIGKKQFRCRKPFTDKGITTLSLEYVRQ